MNKKVITGIVICVALVLMVLAASGINYYLEQKKLVKEKDPNLTQEERAIYEDRLSKANDALGNEALSDEERYNLLMNKAFQLHGLGKLADAKEEFLAASKLKPDNYTAHVALYSLYLDMRDNKGARESIQKAIELKPTDPDIWKKYILVEKERFSASNERLNDLYIEALGKTMSNVDILTAYAVHLESVGNYQSAKEYWQKAIEANPAGKALYEIEIKRLDTLLKQQN